MYKQQCRSLNGFVKKGSVSFLNQLMRQKIISKTLQLNKDEKIYVSMCIFSKHMSFAIFFLNQKICCYGKEMTVA